MYLDESGSLDIHDEENYDVLLVVSIRRQDRMLRLNSKPAHTEWDYEDDHQLQDDWFRSPNPTFKVEDAGSRYNLYIDGTYIVSRDKGDPESLKNITHVQYWYKGRDQTQTALSYALTVGVSDSG